MYAFLNDRFRRLFLLKILQVLLHFGPVNGTGIKELETNVTKHISEAKSMSL
jgi:hypothetical protein